MKKKVLSLLMAVVMTFSLAVTANAAEETAQDLNGDIVILHTNDVHGAIAGYAKVAALKDAYEARGAYVLLMDAGDFIQGDPTVSTSEGATAVELMNLAGYDVVSLGNHEFDYGYQNLKDLEADADFAIVDANVLYNGRVAFEDNLVFTTPDGTKIGVFGLDTPETATKAHPAKIQGVTFLAGEDLYDCAQEQVDALTAEGCNYVICLGHLGIDDESAGNRSIDLLENVDGIDLFIDGHSHSTQDDITAALTAASQAGGNEISVDSSMVNGTVLTSTGTKLESVGVVTIDGETGRIDASTVSAASLTDEDADVAARAAAIQKEIDDEYGTVFAKTEVALNGEREPGNRTEETNLGDLITDALVWGAEREGTEVDAAVTNGGGIRASIAAGDITKKDINTVLPFGNTLSIVQVTGAELLEALEASTYCTPTSIGGFPQVSGIEFTVDTTKAYDQGELYPGSTYYGPKSIQRVTIETVGGEPFDANATYTIATNDFMAAGGDTYYAFAAASVNYDLGIAMDEVVMDYITEELKGTVTAEAYGEPAGRITVDQGLAFTDVAATSPYYDGIEWAVDEGITNGTTATTFSPYQNCTRAQIITYLWRAAGSPEPASMEPAYTDVTDTSLYFFKAVQWASEQGLVEGETFDPYAGCTRAMAVYFMWVAADSPEAAASSFTDVAADADYAGAVNWAVAQGVTLGTGDGSTFSPDTVCQRGQIVTFLYRAANAAA
ncbi:5'-nucleotidase C-terminal domain-containing protein [Oscillibacter valericigenes]|uniref:5'-nucleotidase C-terminal domain-containing protein n=1 Tax=Oscillibacter valericigenes TaxID=351091 RepID=A0ABS2FT44_9FIRM|nr:5'-nucleotidase C-terminal domain-containing protein [Oscillibacter valericigenes]MBM6850510.1 5'-nucleotidase C-terminal domain-containing protein [Oscillibacter valericigenes]